MKVEGDLMPSKKLFTPTLKFNSPQTEIVLTKI